MCFSESSITLLESMPALISDALYSDQLSNNVANINCASNESHETASYAVTTGTNKVAA